jgi:kynurenine formamidase
MQDLARPAHTILLAAGVPVVEHLRGLEQLGVRNFSFFAVPPAIRGGTSFPVRAMAICE